MPVRTLTLDPAAEGAEAAWELFHENSKLGPTLRRAAPAPDGEAGERLGDSLYAFHPTFDLAAPERLAMPIEAVVGAPRQAAVMRPGRMWREALATLLLRGTDEAGRAGSPIEVWFHSHLIDGMQAGLYRLDPAARRVAIIRSGDLTDRIAAALMEPDLARRSAIQLFVAADLARLAARYGERGYRYALVETGSLARRLDFVAAALGLVTVATGEFRDRDIDALLALDGLARGVLFMVAIGKTGRGSGEREPVELGSVRLGRRRRRRGRR